MALVGKDSLNVGLEINLYVLFDSIKVNVV